MDLLEKERSIQQFVKILVPGEQIKVYQAGKKVIFEGPKDSKFLFFYLYYEDRKYTFGVPITKEQLEGPESLERVVKRAVLNFAKELEKHGTPKIKINR